MSMVDEEVFGVAKRKVTSCADGSYASKKQKQTKPENINRQSKSKPAEDTLAIDHVEQNIVPSGSADEPKKDSLLSLISGIAAKNAIASGSTQKPKLSNVSSEVTNSLLKDQWQLHLVPQLFSTVEENDVINWTGESSLCNIMAKDKPSEKRRKKSKEAPKSDQNWMLNASRTVCAFVHTNIVAGKPKPTYFCNFCKFTDGSYGGFYQHLNHHIFVCGQCAYNSSCRLDIEIHRERANHMTPLASGYLAHKQNDFLLDKCNRKFIPQSGLVEWQTIKEGNEELIVIQASKLPESAVHACKKAHPQANERDNQNVGPISLICALPYHRFVPQRTIHKNVLEYHCNFCQSTPIYTKEFYRHMDFHAFNCKDCDFQCFTNLELFLHQRNKHYDSYKDILDKLIIFVPERYTMEEDFIKMAIESKKWSVVLELPRCTTLDASNGQRQALLLKETEWRCKVCNNFVINKGGLTTHLTSLHNIKQEDVHLYMEPMT